MFPEVVPIKDWTSSLEANCSVHFKAGRVPCIAKAQTPPKSISLACLNSNECIRSRRLQTAKHSFICNFMADLPFLLLVPFFSFYKNTRIKYIYLSRPLKQTLIITLPHVSARELLLKNQITTVKYKRQ